MSIHHLQSCFSKEMANMIMYELSRSQNQNYIEENILDPIINKVQLRLRTVVITIGILLSLLILLNTLIILQFIYNRKR